MKDSSSCIFQLIKATILNESKQSLIKKKIIFLDDSRLCSLWDACKFFYRSGALPFDQHYTNKIPDFVKWI